MRKNCIIVLRVNNSQCGAPASWAARHTTVCLDQKSNLPNLLDVFNNYCWIQFNNIMM